MRRTENRPHPKKIQVKFEGLSFGDGTGYGGEGGVALPRKLPEQSNLSRCTPQQNKSGPRSLGWLANAQRRKPNQLSSVDLPAIFLPVNFWSADLLPPNSLTPEPEPTDCCPGPNCTSLINHVEHPCVNCPDQNRPTITYCGDPAGSCFAPEYDSIECFTGKGQPYLCQTVAMPECGGDRRRLQRRLQVHLLRLRRHVTQTVPTNSITQIASAHRLETEHSTGFAAARMALRRRITKVHSQA
jgi:hypothetical protein